MAESDAEAGLVINEFMAKNALTIADEDGNSFDWIELYNTTASDISLCGWAITVDLDDPQRFVEIARENTVPANGHRVLWMSGDAVSAAADHVAVHLPLGGGEIGLVAPNGEFVDRLIYGEQVTDLSAARDRDASIDWEITWHATPGQPNSAASAAAAQPPDDTPEMVPAAGDVTELLLGYDQMPEIGIELEPDSYAGLESDPYTYVPGFLVYEGRQYGPVGIRLKGQNSFQPIDQKPSFRINVDEYVDGAKFVGLDDLTLNNMDDDFSMVHERLAYWVARQLGPASRSNHALVTVNGEFYGVYANVETVKRHMIARWFDDADGSLFEATDVDFRPALVSGFELESGPDDRALLEGLTNALTNQSPDAAMAAAAEFVDMDSFLNYWAMCAIVGQFDAFPYSNPGDDYFVYADPATGKLWFMPWGMDETFYSGSFDVSAVQSVLASQCEASPSCYQSFVDRTWDALDMTEQLDLTGERVRVIAQVAPHIDRDQRKPYDDAMVAEFHTQLRYFIDGRREHLAEILPPRSTP